MYIILYDSVLVLITHHVHGVPILLRPFRPRVGPEPLRWIRVPASLLTRSAAHDWGESSSEPTSEISLSDSMEKKLLHNNLGTKYER